MERSLVKEKETKDNKLEQQYTDLQQDWDSYKQSNPRTLRRCSTDTCSIVNTFNLLNNSPRNLMSSLQINDLAVEIRMERRAAIESGKVKGRRLFEVLLEGETEVGFGGREEIYSGWSDLVQESEVRSVSSYASDDDDNDINGGSKEEVSPVSSCSSSSLPGENVEREKLVVEGEKVVASVEDKRDVIGVGGYGGRWMIVMVWLAIVFALGFISMRCFDGYGDEDEVIIVPT